MYTDLEIAQIQDSITGKLGILPTEIEAAQRKFAGVTEIPGHMTPFLRIAGANPDLYDRLSTDPLVERYSMFGFFPESIGLVYGNEASPGIRICGRNRGVGAII